jgi:hypothetical protein
MAIPDEFAEQLNTLISGINGYRCDQYYHPLLNAAKEAKTKGDPVSERLLALLAKVTSPDLGNGSDDNPMAPFGPLESLSEDDINVLKNLCYQIQNHELKARVADVLWMLERDHTMARVAIDSYGEAGERTMGSSGWGYGIRQLERALKISVKLGDRECLDRSVERIERILDTRADGDVSRASARLMALLQEYGALDRGIRHAESARTIALLAETDRAWELAEVYWRTAGDWYRLLKDANSERECRIASAEVFVKWSDDVLSSEKPSFLLAASYIERAIETLRKVSETRERVEELMSLLTQYQKRANEEMIEVSTEFDVTEEARASIDKVRNKAFDEALWELLLIAAPPARSCLRALVEDMASEVPLQFQLSQRLVDHNGKVIGVGHSAMAEDEKDIEEACCEHMHEEAEHFQHYLVVARIRPARQRIAMEHNPTLHQFIDWMSTSPMVPPGRERIYALGLLAGLNGDFLVSTHLLVPQLEELLRFLLNKNDVRTSGLSSEGLQREYDLNRLLDMPEVGEILTDDIAFDLEGLLVHPFGSNLRNRLAHGLMGWNDFQSPWVEYLWWAILRLCILPVLTYRQGD